MTDREFVQNFVPNARYLNLDGNHCIDDHAGDRYLAYGRISRRQAWHAAREAVAALIKRQTNNEKRK